MSQITKCYKVTVVLTYWEASGEVSELSYTSLLFISSKRSYCMTTKSLNGGCSCCASVYWQLVVVVVMFVITKGSNKH